MKTQRTLLLPLILSLLLLTLLSKLLLTPPLLLSTL